MKIWQVVGILGLTALTGTAYADNPQLGTILGGGIGGAAGAAIGSNVDGRNGAIIGGAIGGAAGAAVGSSVDQGRYRDRHYVPTSYPAGSYRENRNDWHDNGRHRGQYKQKHRRHHDDD